RGLPVESREMDATAAAECGVVAARLEEPVHPVKREFVGPIQRQREMILLRLGSRHRLAPPCGQLSTDRTMSLAWAVRFRGCDQTRTLQPPRLRSGHSRKPQACDPPISTRQPFASACRIAFSMSFRMPRLCHASAWYSRRWQLSTRLHAATNT